MQLTKLKYTPFMLLAAAALFLSFANAEKLGGGYHQFIYYYQVDKGGHFAAWAQPELFSERDSPRVSTAASASLSASSS